MASQIEVLMDDGSWVCGRLLKAGVGKVPGDGWAGWAFCAYEDLRWWAAPGEWRDVPLPLDRETVS